MISTHWRRPHRPSEHELQPLDVLARQAADLIERNEVEKALRESRSSSGGSLLLSNPATTQ
jgi:hypothetical protein